MSAINELRANFNRKLSAIQTTFTTLLFTIFLILFIIAAIALILASVLTTRANGNSICENCDGIVSKVLTDNQTLSPIINQTLKFNGICGLQSFINSIDNITFKNLGQLSPYIVGKDNCSQFKTPQAAYLQVILDGKGGSQGNGAVILIKPGIYDFGNIQFPITQSVISFQAISPGTVIFSSTGLNGGLYIKIPVNLLENIVFSGITFGLENDPNGFLINNTAGELILSQCYSQNSNFRIFLGGEDLTIFSILNSQLKTFPPNDFITTTTQFVEIFIGSTEIIQVHSISDGFSQGGHIINMQNGADQVRLYNLIIISNLYDGIILGPLTNNTYSVQNFIDVQNMNLLMFDQNFGHFLNQEGPINLDLQSVNFELQGPLIFQNSNTTSGENHNILISNSQITTLNATIKYNISTALSIGINNFKIVNSFLDVTVGTFIINIPNANGTDLLNVTVSNLLITTQALPLGDYAVGPGPFFATINIANSATTNGATNANGFTVNHLTNI